MSSNRNKRDVSLITRTPPRLARLSRASTAIKMHVATAEDGMVKVEQHSLLDSDWEQYDMKANNFALEEGVSF